MLKYIEITLSNLMTRKTMYVFLLDCTLVIFVSYWIKNFVEFSNVGFVGSRNFRLLVITPLFANLPLYAIYRTLADNLQTNTGAHRKTLTYVVVTLYLVVSFVCILTGVHSYWMIYPEGMIVLSGINGEENLYSWQEVKSKTKSCHLYYAVRVDTIYLMLDDGTKFSLMDELKGNLEDLTSLIKEKTGNALALSDGHGCSKRVEMLFSRMSP